MKLSNCVNLVQKIGAFTLIYFFSFSSYQAQVIPKEDIVNNSSLDSEYSGCNKNSNLFDISSKFSIYTKEKAVFDSQQKIKNEFITWKLDANNFTLGEYSQLSGVQKSLPKSLMIKGVESVFFSENLQGTFQFGQFGRVNSSLTCEQCGQYPQELCKHSDCVQCPECEGIG